MGGIIGGSGGGGGFFQQQGPTPVAHTEPIVLPPVPTPVASTVQPPTIASPVVQQAADTITSNVRPPMGQAQTILTSPQGDTSMAPTRKKILLGS
jgi:hypothetical protein